MGLDQLALPSKIANPAEERKVRDAFADVTIDCLSEMFPDNRSISEKLGDGKNVVHGRVDATLCRNALAEAMQRRGANQAAVTELLTRVDGIGGFYTRRTPPLRLHTHTWTAVPPKVQQAKSWWK